MIYAIDSRSFSFRRARARRMPRVRPYRLLACALLLVVAGMLIGIDHTETYERERIEAEARYNAALSENESLRRRLAEAEDDGWLRETARKEYGFTFEGEVVYEPVFRQ